MLLACEVPAIGFAWSGLRRHICDSVGRTEDALLPEQRKRLPCAANVMRRMIMLLASEVPAIAFTWSSLRKLICESTELGSVGYRCLFSDGGIAGFSDPCFTTTCLTSELKVDVIVTARPS